MAMRSAAECDPTAGLRPALASTLTQPPPPLAGTRRARLTDVASLGSASVLSFPVAEFSGFFLARQGNGRLVNRLAHPGVKGQREAPSFSKHGAHFKKAVGGGAAAPPPQQVICHSEVGQI